MVACCLALGWWGARPAGAAFISANGVITGGSFVTATVNQTIPGGTIGIPGLPSFVPVGGADPPATGANAAGVVSLGINFVPGTNAFGVQPQTTFVSPYPTLQGTYLTANPSAVTGATFTVNYSANFLTDANGFSGPADFGFFLGGNLVGTPGNFAFFSATVTYGVIGIGVIAPPQTVSYNTADFGIVSGPFADSVGAPTVFLNVPANATLNLTGSFTFNANSGSIFLATPTFGGPGPEDVPEPAGLTLLAAGVICLAVGAGRRLGRPRFSRDLA